MDCLSLSPSGSVQTCKQQLRSRERERERASSWVSNTVQTADICLTPSPLICLLPPYKRLISLLNVGKWSLKSVQRKLLLLSSSPSCSLLLFCTHIYSPPRHRTLCISPLTSSPPTFLLLWAFPLFNPSPEPIPQKLNWSQKEGTGEEEEEEQKGEDPFLHFSFPLGFWAERGDIPSFPFLFFEFPWMG